MHRSSNATCALYIDTASIISPKPLLPWGSLAIVKVRLRSYHICISCYALSCTSLSFALLGWSLNLGIEPHEMVINGIFRPHFRFLFPPAQQRSASPPPQKNIPTNTHAQRPKRNGTRRTGESIQALSDCSSCWHPAAALPEDAQHPER